MVGWHHWLNMSLSKLREIVKDREAWHAAVHRGAKDQTCTDQQQKRTESNWKAKTLFPFIILSEMLLI